ncbi:MAG: GNAT family N-acetyltransferase [Streptococcaceae bacterium]|jgi:ribosomal protein S18 acetylase RimI-like enzyme|nr:GNAT family N-acetyltransferase [Streptococcaceae bacterium]
MTINYQAIKTEVEVEQLFKMIQVIWPEVFIPIIGQAQVAYMLENYQSIDKIQEEIAAGVAYYLIESDGQVCGYLAYEPQDQQLFISKVYLLKAWRGRGISRQVFKWLTNIALAHDKDKLQLHVNRDNTKAVAIYQQLGFEIIQAVDTPLGSFLLTDYWMEKKL